MMSELDQYQLLIKLKKIIDGTWDDVANCTGITSRALKSYRLPAQSKGHRTMAKFVRQAVEMAIDEYQKKRQLD
jgi:hypothetical protein